jgi:hypothetical protein
MSDTTLYAFENTKFHKPKCHNPTQLVQAGPLTRTFERKGSTSQGSVNKWN